MFKGHGYEYGECISAENKKVHLKTTDINIYMSVHVKSFKSDIFLPDIQTNTALELKTPLNEYR